MSLPVVERCAVKVPRRKYDSLNLTTGKMESCSTDRYLVRFVTDQDDNKLREFATCQLATGLWAIVQPEYQADAN